MAKRNTLRRKPRGSKLAAGRTILFILIAVIAAVLGTGAFILFEPETPTLVLKKEIKYLGGSITIPFHASDGKSGISSVTMTLEQDGKSRQLFNNTFQRKAWFSAAGPSEVEETVVLDPKKTGLKDGKAELVIAVRDFSLNGKFKGNENIIRVPVIIDTKPPRVTVDYAQRYIRSGGSGIVIYNLSEATDRHGVKIDDTFFQGYPLQNLKNRFIAYIALPWHAKKPENTRVVAIDEAGNEGKSIFSMKFKKVPEKNDRINISDGFLKRKIPEFKEHYPEMSGSMLDKFLFVNNEVRKQNAQSIYDACKNPLKEQLWQDKFLRMAGANRAGFADQRSYYYQGKTIDHQTHLGMDIASTARVPIKAANRGKVVFAEYLGIYGNSVILDHGQGIFSLYSHLSRIDTAVGTVVEKDKLIGHSGVSGMAGGDHLHFSMLVHGIFVTPVEWWDQHWIDVNIKNLISGN